MPDSGEKWTVEKGRIDEIKRVVMEHGGIEDKMVKAGTEAWRMRIGRAVFTMYRNGTLYNNMADSENVLELRHKITKCCNPRFENAGREILIGVDETGKGEVAGEEVLCGARFPSGMYGEVESVAGTADTKSNKAYWYWDRVFSSASRMSAMGLRFDVEKISPEKIDKYNINRLMDAAYKRIISRLMEGVPPDRTSIIVDDYQIGRELKDYLGILKRKGVMVIVTHKADDRFLEVRLASALAKREREKSMAEINDRFAIDGIHIGSGGPSDPGTQKWLAAWKKSGQEWPWFIKKSYSTIRRLDGLPEAVKKSNDPHSGTLGRWME